MPDELDNKIEAKADTIVDAGSVTSGSTAVLIMFQRMKDRIKNFIIHIVGGQHMYFLKTQNILEFSMPLLQ